MTALSVDPLLLLPAADKARVVHQSLAGVARALAGLDAPDTGRADGVAMAATVLTELGAATAELARAALRDAHALSTAGTTYAVAEQRIAGQAACS